MQQEDLEGQADDTEARRQAPLNFPEYAYDDLGRLEARFADEPPVPVAIGRRRAYPGISSECPPTLPFYSIMSELRPRASHVLDVGCGAAVGTATMVDAFPRVIGIDQDANAVKFARQFLPYGTFFQHDLGSAPPVQNIEAAIVADVLGQVALPAALLQSLRDVMAPDSVLLIAEPKAFGGQSLRAPVRHAFSRASIEHLLTYSGFEPDAWVADNTFVACCAVPSEDLSWHHLRRAQQALLDSDAKTALEAFQAAGKRGSRKVKLEACLGEALVQLACNEGDLASQSFMKALEFESGESRALCGLARVSAATGDVPSAMELAIKAAHTEPTNAEAVTMVGTLAEAMERPEDALNALRLANALDPSNRDVATQLAQMAAALGDCGHSISVFERLRSYEDDLGQHFHVTMAWLLINDGREEDAKLEARLALAMNPEDPAVQELWQALGGMVA